IFQGLAVECLSEGNRKLIFPDTARSRHQQRLSNAIFTDRALKHFLNAVVSYERREWHARGQVTGYVGSGTRERLQETGGQLAGDVAAVSPVPCPPSPVICPFPPFPVPCNLFPIHAERFSR